MPVSFQKSEHEALVASLLDEETLEAYKGRHDGFRIGGTARFLGGLLVTCGDVLYGKEPSYGKFKAIEVIARIPYQSWEVVGYMLLTLFYSDEQRAVRLAKTLRFGRFSQDNETMHVVVLSQLARRYGQYGFLRYTLVPLLFSFFYFASSFLLYLASPRRALELNYVFEDHAFAQYGRFIDRHEEALKARQIQSEFLNFYGRRAATEYDLFRTIRCDEIIHRNLSAEQALFPDHGTGA